MKPAFIPKQFPESFDIIQFPHPSTGQLGSFIILDQKLYEVNLIDRPHSSFFIGECVVADGSAFFILPFNPIYLILTLRSTHLKELNSLDDFFDQTPFKEYANFFKPYVEKIGESTNVAGIGDQSSLFWRLDEKKIDDFLLSQAKKLLPYIKTLRPNDPDFILIESAWDILRHYISKDLSESLKMNLKTLYPGSFPVKKLADVICDVKEEKPVKAPPKTSKKKDKSKPPPGNTSLFDFLSPKKK